jgi:hypothetical protein
MPRVPDASMMTRAIKAGASIPAAPVKKSSSFAAPAQGSYINAMLRTSEVQRYRVGSLLANPTWKSLQRPKTRFLEGSRPAGYYVYKSIEDDTDPGNGYIGVATASPNDVLVVSIVDRNGQTISEFVAGAAVSTQITLTTSTQVVVLTRTAVATNSGTHYSIPVTGYTQGSITADEQVTLSYS